MKNRRIQDELDDLNKKFTYFLIQPGEKVCTGIDRLNGIIEKMTKHGQPTLKAQRSLGNPLTQSALANHLVKNQPHVQ